MTLAIFIPMKLPSLSNTRMHWRAMDKLKKLQKFTVAAFLSGHNLPAGPVVVTMVRIGKRKLDDDNLASAFKYIRDSIAKKYGHDDGSDFYDWHCEQRIDQKLTGIEIFIRERR